MNFLSRFFVVLILILTGLGIGGCDGGTRGTGPSDVRVSGKLQQLGSEIGISGAKITAQSTGETVLTNEQGQFKFESVINPNEVSLTITVNASSSSVTVRNVPEDAEEVFIKLGYEEKQKSVTVIETEITRRKPRDEDRQDERPRGGNNAKATPISQYTPAQNTPAATDNTPAPNNNTPLPEQTPGNPNLVPSIVPSASPTIVPQPNQPTAVPTNEVTPLPTPIVTQPAAQPVATPSMPSISGNLPRYHRSQVLQFGGSKDAGSSVLLNGVQIVPTDDKLTWSSFTALTVEGVNALHFTSEKNGLTSATRTYYVVKDSILPALSGSPIVSVTNSILYLDFTFTESVRMTLRFSISGGPEITGTEAVSNFARTHTINLGPIKTGEPYTYSINATDMAGNSVSLGGQTISPEGNAGADTLSGIQLQEVVSTSVGTIPLSGVFAYGDLTNDGRMESISITSKLYLGGGSVNLLEVFTLDENNNLKLLSSLDLSTLAATSSLEGFRGSEIKISDYTGDGKVDIAIITPEGPYIFKGDGKGKLNLIYIPA